MLADMATELDAARMLTLKAAAAKDRQERSTLEASMAKLAASEAAHKAADKAMQILASAGYRRGSVVERLFRDVRATEIYQGTSEAQRMIIAAQDSRWRLSVGSAGRMGSARVSVGRAAGEASAQLKRDDAYDKKAEPPRVRENHHRRRRRPPPRPATVFGQAPTMMTPKSVKPVVVASNNGNKFKNGGTKTCVETAFSMITGGSDVLDALIAGVNIVELDPLDDSVGYGGLPNADGVVQLDSCCMHGPKKRAGGVAEIEGVRTPSKVAQLVMDTTDHHLLVGKGAQDFARNMGFKIEDDLNTENSREQVARVEAPHRSAALPVAEGAPDAPITRSRWT